MTVLPERFKAEILSIKLKEQRFLAMLERCSYLFSLVQTHYSPITCPSFSWASRFFLSNA